MDARQQRGLEIAATMNLEKKADGMWSVPSQRLNGKYAVDASAKRCTCPDYESRHKPCKHVFAVEFVLRREAVTNGATTTVTETAAVRVTYTQNWPAYNAAQTTEKTQFCRLLHELVADVPEPVHTRGRRPLALSDMLFAAAFKVYSTVSARRFMCDLHAAQARGLIRHAPHYNSIFNVTESERTTPLLYDLVTASSLPLRELECDFAADSTGFGTSQSFRYYSMKYGREQPSHDWLKAHAMVGVKTNVVTAIVVSDRNDHDSPHFPALVEATARNFEMREVSADKAYHSHRNLMLVESKGAAPFIPFRTNSKPHPESPTWNRLYHYFALNRGEFAAHYHKRSNVESTFSSIKRVFGDSVRSRTPTAQVNEVLLKVLCHNIRCLIHEAHELGIAPEFERMTCPTIPAAA